MSVARRVQITIGLLLALALPFAHLSTLGKRYSGLGPLWGGEVGWWSLFAVIVAYVFFVERKRLSSIGYRVPGLMDIGAGLIAAMISIAGVLFILNVVLPALHLEEGQAQEADALFATPLLYRVLLVTRAAFVEETLFRGYGFERLTELTSNKWFAAFATFAFFGLAHYSPAGGWGDVLVGAEGGLIFAVLYLWRRNIWSNIICHWIVDGTGFILIPMLSGAH